jgi:hypothetical protein
MVFFAEKAISVLEGGKGPNGSTQITFYQTTEGRHTVVGIVGTMMAKRG